MGDHATAHGEPTPNPDHFAKLKEGVSAWNAWRRNKPRVKPELQGGDLRGANLRGAILWEANLQRADLRAADLQGAFLSDAELQGALLSEANLEWASLVDANLRGACLADANLRKANLHRANLSDADLRRADLRGARILSAQFEGANLTGANLRMTALEPSTDRKAETTRDSETYRVHFGFSRQSKFYPQALELAKFARAHDVRGEGDDTWHVVTLTGDQVHLMATLHRLAVRLPGPRIYGASVQSVRLWCRQGRDSTYPYASDASIRLTRSAVERLTQERGGSLAELDVYLRSTYVEPKEKDMARVSEYLRSLGYLGRVHPNTGEWIEATKTIDEPLTSYRRIRDLIRQSELAEAAHAYYETLGGEYYGALTPELLYLKRLGCVPLLGRDLLYFREESSRQGLVAANLQEYVSCIDRALADYRQRGRKMPVDILVEHVPTEEQLFQKRKQRMDSAAWVTEGRIERNNEQLTLQEFRKHYFGGTRGRLFTTYTNPVLACNIIESDEARGREDPRYAGLWTTFPPERHQTEVLERGLHLASVDAFRHRRWTREKSRLREPDFRTVASNDEIEKGTYSTQGVRYTGRTHEIEGQLYYEINLIRFNADKAGVIGNPFIEAVEEILREAEDLLRIDHGLPRIGEGWVMETELYRLVKSKFPDAQQHGSPQWLKPQHLDVFVPSRNLAFEYHGRQHFEPIDFFGGKEALEATRERDTRKARRCKANRVALVIWHYDVPITTEELIKRLKELAQGRHRGNRVGACGARHSMEP